MRPRDLRKRSDSRVASGDENCTARFARPSQWPQRIPHSVCARSSSKVAWCMCNTYIVPWAVRVHLF